MKFNNIFFIFIFMCFSVRTYAIENKAAVNVMPLLKTTQSWDGKQIVYPAGKAEITSLLVEIAPGGETGWHQHPVPSFAMLLEGTLEITLKDGRVKRLQAGAALAEVIDTLHNGRNVGDAPVKILVVYMGVVGQPLVIKAQ
ncbi:MAG: cupin domain-containing protein [Gammaproteobacteria bacterium]|nr:cupin domain-containing protein [Gammaproteobacteria bacterium]